MSVMHYILQRCLLSWTHLSKMSAYICIVTQRLCPAQCQWHCLVFDRHASLTSAVASNVAFRVRCSFRLLLTGLSQLSLTSRWRRRPRPCAYHGDGKVIWATPEGRITYLPGERRNKWRTVRGVYLCYVTTVCKPSPVGSRFWHSCVLLLLDQSMLPHHIPDTCTFYRRLTWFHLFIYSTCRLYTRILQKLNVTSILPQI